MSKRYKFWTYNFLAITQLCRTLKKELNYVEKLILDLATLAVPTQVLDLENNILPFAHIWPSYFHIPQSNFAKQESSEALLAKRYLGAGKQTLHSSLLNALEIANIQILPANKTLSLFQRYFKVHSPLLNLYILLRCSVYSEWGSECRIYD